MHHGMYSNLSGLHPLDAISTPPLETTENVFKHCQMSPGGKINHLTANPRRGGLLCESKEIIVTIFVK